jgi:hypothetical protein
MGPDKVYLDEGAAACEADGDRSAGDFHKFPTLAFARREKYIARIEHAPPRRAKAGHGQCYSRAAVIRGRAELIAKHLEAAPRQNGVGLFFRRNGTALEKSKDKNERENPNRSAQMLRASYAET